MTFKAMSVIIQVLGVALLCATLQEIHYLASPASLFVAPREDVFSRSLQKAWLEASSTVWTQDMSTPSISCEGAGEMASQETGMPGQHIVFWTKNWRRGTEKANEHRKDGRTAKPPAPGVITDMRSLSPFFGKLIRHGHHSLLLQVQRSSLPVSCC